MLQNLMTLFVYLGCLSQNAYKFFCFVLKTALARSAKPIYHFIITLQLIVKRMSIKKFVLSECNNISRRFIITSFEMWIDKLCFKNLELSYSS